MGVKSRSPIEAGSTGRLAYRIIAFVKPFIVYNYASQPQLGRIGAEGDAVLEFA